MYVYEEITFSIRLLNKLRAIRVINLIIQQQIMF